MTDILTPFDETLTAERTPLFTLSSVHPLSTLRNVVTGTPSATTEEYALSAGDKIESAEIARYIPGFAAEAGIGIRVGTLPTGSQVMRWGLYDAADGFFFELTTDGLFAVVRRNSVDTRTAQASWSVDQLDGVFDGDAQSSKTLDLTDGNIFQIRFTWYGYGQIEFRVVDTSTGGRQQIITAHRVAPTTTTSVRNPNLPITAEVTGAGDGVLYVAGRQFSVLGRYVPQTRTHSISRTLTGIGTSFTPVVAFRRKNSDQGKRIKLRAQGMSILTSGNAEVALVVNPTITFGTAIVPTLGAAAKTACEFSVNPTEYAVGASDPLLVDLVGSGGSGANATGEKSWPGLGAPVPRLQPVVMLVRALSGTVDVTALLTALEEW